ncbi:MAG: hypothetical protein AAF721_07595 [Myxococcota bacterium]
MKRVRGFTGHLGAVVVLLCGCSSLQQAAGAEAESSDTEAMTPSGSTGDAGQTGASTPADDGRPDSGGNGADDGGTTGGSPSDDGPQADDGGSDRPACCGPSTVGCDQPDLAACVCEIDASCCVFGWDESCADLAVNECGGCDDEGGTTGDASTSSSAGMSTGMGIGAESSTGGDEPQGSSDDGSIPGGECCQTSAMPGCGGTEVEDCVCAFDEFCCNQAWDDQCVSEAVNDCNATC